MTAALAFDPGESCDPLDAWVDKGKEGVDVTTVVGLDPP